MNEGSADPVVRKTDLDTIISWINMAKSGRVTAGLIAGRAGVGKTVLAKQAESCALRLGCVTAAASGRFREAPPLVAERLVEQLHLPPVAGNTSPERRVREELRRLGQQGACVMLSIDDIQDLHVADLSFLEELILFPPLSRLLVLLTHRTHADDRDEPTIRTLERLETAGALCTVGLGPITEIEATRWLARTFPPSAVSPRFVRDLVAFTGGSPQWISLYIRNTPMLPADQRSALLTGSQLITMVPPPKSIDRIVERRVGAYRHERFVADALAVWAAPASVEMLVELTDRPRREVEAAIERLERAAIVFGTRSVSLPTFDFLEPIVGASLRESMPLATRARLLRGALSQTARGRAVAEGRLTHVAEWQLEAADVLGQQELATTTAAARALIERSRFEAARSLLGRLTERLTFSGLPVPSEAMILLAESHSRAGAFKEAAELLVKSHAASDKLSVERLIRAARDAVAIGRDDDAATTYEALLADEGLGPLERARVLLDAARLDAALGRAELSASRSAAAAAAAEAAGDEGLASIAHLEYLHVLVRAARPVSLQEVKNAFGQARRSGGRGVLGRAMGDIAHVIIDHSTVSRAIRWWRRAARLAERDEDLAGLSGIVLALAGAETEAGQWDRAEQSIAIAVQIDTSLHRTRALRRSMALQHMLRALRGHADASDLRRNDSSWIADRFGGPNASVLYYVAQFEQQMRLAHFENTERAILEAESILADVPGYERALLVEVLPRAASLYYRTKNVPRLDSVIATFGSHTEQSGRTLPLLGPLTDQIHAYQWSLRGDPLRAADLQLSAAARFAELGYLWRAAIAHQEAAEASRDGGLAREAALHFKTSFDLFSRMGAMDHLTCIRAEMLALGVRARRRSEPRNSTLTARQWQIAELAGQDMTDSEIADRLGISPRTVSTHIHQILRAIGLRSRLQIEAWIDAHQQDRARALDEM